MNTPQRLDDGIKEQHDQAIEEHLQKRREILNNFQYVPIGLISCLDLLLASCYKQRKQGDGRKIDTLKNKPYYPNIIDLIHTYLVSDKYGPIYINYQDDNNKAHKKEMTIEESECPDTLLSIRHSGSFFHYNLPELLEETQIRNIYDELSEIKRDIYKYMKEETAHGTD